jgi:2-keto-myo-inositol isomerase
VIHQAVNLRTEQFSNTIRSSKSSSMQPAISQLCTLNSSFEDDLKGYADATGAAVEFWLTKLENYLQTHTIEDVRMLCAERELKPAAATFHGGLLLSQGDARRASWTQFEQRLDLCGALKIPTLIMTPDFLGPFSHTDIERAQVSLKQAGQAAAQRGVRLALEFQSRGTFLNNLQTAAGFVDSIQEPSVGLCIDSFHFYVGSSKTEDLGLLHSGNLFHVQLSDLADCPREIATDADRIIPGDGDVPLQLIVNRLREINYTGFVSLEVANAMFWSIPARQIGEIGLTALRIALGQNA